MFSTLMRQNVALCGIGLNTLVDKPFTRQQNLTYSKLKAFPDKFHTGSNEATVFDTEESIQGK